MYPFEEWNLCQKAPLISKKHNEIYFLSVNFFLQKIYYWSDHIAFLEPLLLAKWKIGPGFVCKL